MKRLIFACTIVLFFNGCQKPGPVAPIPVNAQIESYLTGAELGRELFRTDGLILADPYQLPFSTATFRDSVIGHTRTIDYTEPKDIFYTPVDARGVLSVQAVVSDIYTIQTRRTPGTQVDTTTRALYRDGWFLKVGRDTDPYFGWILWGFNGTCSASGGVEKMPLSIRCVTQDSVVFQGDDNLVRLHKDDNNISIGYYLLVEEIRNIPQGNRILFQAEPSNLSSPVRYAPALSAKGEVGLEKSMMTRQTNSLYRDTLKTQSPNNSLWNIVYVESFRDDQFRFIKSWVIPYRVPQ